MKAYRIANWADHFENNRTKDMKVMQWVPIPNKHDGDGYTELLDHPNGAAHFGAWVACVQVASKSHPRGTLLRTPQKAHDFRSLERITRVPADVWAEALPRLESIGWLESFIVEGQEDTEIPQEPAVCPQSAGTFLPGMEWKGREGKDECSPPAADEPTPTEEEKYPEEFEAFWLEYPRKVGKRKALKAWKAAKSRGAQDLILITRAFAKTPKGQSGEFCPHPSTWLSESRYKDEPAEWERDGTQPAKTEHKCRLPTPEEDAEWNPNG